MYLDKIGVLGEPIKELTPEEEKQASDYQSHYDRKTRRIAHCKFCGDEFTPTQENKYYCCEEHKQLKYRSDKIKHDLTHLDKSNSKSITLQIECINCGTLFTPKREWQHFCTKECRRTYNNHRRALKKKTSK